MRRRPSSKTTQLAMRIKRRFIDLGVPPAAMARPEFSYCVSHGFVIVVWDRGASGEMALFPPETFKMPDIGEKE